MKQWKRVVATVLTFSLLVSGLYIVAPKMEEVKAAGSSTQTEGTIFAGYYVDKELTIPSDVESKYPKYVDSGVLSVKMQVKKNEEAGTYDMRVLSTVDSLNYKTVGFDVYFDGATEAVPFETTTVFKRISGTSNVTYKYSPKVIDTDSEYFVTGTIKGIAEDNLAKTFYIRPFWKTLDGTKIYGEGRYFTVSDATAKTVINIPVKMDDPGASVTGVTLAGTAVDDANVELLDYKDGYAHLNITVDDKTALKSASVVKVGAGDAAPTAVYRNLESRHVGGTDVSLFDNSFYTAYQADDAFVIVTAADLYGLRNVTNDELIGKTVYLAADIDLNEVDKMDWTTGSAKTGVDYTPNAWIGIYFKGNFDGQMHEIRGLYGNAGLFTKTYVGSSVKDFKLTNSYINGNGAQVGSIVGEFAGGSIDTVYSSATVVSSFANVGGIAGSAASSTINNCQYAGELKSTSSENFVYAGGIVGQNFGSLSIKNTSFTGTMSIGTSRWHSTAGGILGGVATAGATTDILGCVSAGTYNAPNSGGGVKSGIGLIQATATTTVRNTCSTETNKVLVMCADGVTITSKNNVQKSAAELSGSDGWACTLLNDDYYVPVTSGIPELKSFTTKTEEQMADVSAIKRVDTDWYSSNDTEFILYTEEELVGLMQLAGQLENGSVINFSGKTIKLGADLVLNEGDASTWKTSAPKRSYSPIQPYTWSGREFLGTFDGQGHTISGLYIPANSTASTSGSEDAKGLFGMVGSQAIIKNFKLVNSYINGGAGRSAAAVVARAFKTCTIRDIYTDAIVESNNYEIGGILGTTWADTTPVNIINCEFAGEIYANKSGATVNTGGILGAASSISANITGCLFSGKIQATAATDDFRIGGMAGWVNTGCKVTIDNCISVGTIEIPSTTTPNYVGSLIGRTAEKTSVLTNTYGAYETWPAQTYWLGYNNPQVTNQLPKATLTDASAYVFTSLSDTYWTPVQGSTPQLNDFQTRATVDVSELNKADTSWYTNNTGATTYTLATAEELYGLAQLSRTYDFAGKTIELDETLTEAIDMQADKGVTTMSIGRMGLPFAGTFDGNGKTITGLQIISEEDGVGMFGYTAAGTTVRDFRLLDSHIEGKSVVGSIVGRALGNVDTIYSEAEVVATTGGINGGIVAQAWNTAISITNCWFAGNLYVNGADIFCHSGGILGENRATTATIENCLYSGWIITKTSQEYLYIGGINGSTGIVAANTAAKTIVTDCVSVGDFDTCGNTSNIRVSMIIGEAHNAESLITDTYGSEDSWKYGYAFINGSEHADKETHLLPLASMINDQLSGLDASLWAFIQDGTPELRSFMKGTEYVAQ